MKILIINGGFLPAKKYGGPVTSIKNFVDNMHSMHTIYVVTKNHDLNSTEKFENIENGWNPTYNCFVQYINDRDQNYRFFYNTICNINPDIVYISSIFDAKMNIPIIRVCRKMKKSLLYAPRGEICKNAYKIGNVKKRIFVSLMRFIHMYDNIWFQATSEEEQVDIENILGVERNKIFMLENLPVAALPLEQKSKKSGEIHAIFLSRIHLKKNLKTAIAAFENINGNATLDIYGPKEDTAYFNECMEYCKSYHSNISIKYCGCVDPGKTTEVFRKYDCFVFPTLSENYGHVIAESLSANVPIIISKGTTPWDDIEGNGGYTASLNCIEEFTQKIQRICDFSQNEYNDFLKKLVEYRQDKLNSKELVRRYNDCFNKILEH